MYTMPLGQLLKLRSLDACSYTTCVDCDYTEETRRLSQIETCLNCGSYSLQICEYAHQLMDAKRLDDGFDRLCDSIYLFGIETPIAIMEEDGTLWVANGHHRLAALEEMYTDSYDVPIKYVPADYEPSMDDEYPEDAEEYEYA